jgi:hypothetical protein
MGAPLGHGRDYGHKYLFDVGRQQLSTAWKREIHSWAGTTGYICQWAELRGSRRTGPRGSSGHVCAAYKSVSTKQRIHKLNELSVRLPLSLVPR